MVNYPRQNISFSLRKQSYVYNHILVKIRKLKVCNLIQKVRVKKITVLILINQNIVGITLWLHIWLNTIRVINKNYC